MKKKVLSLLLVAAMGISMLVGCGGGTDKDTEAGNTQNEGPVDVTLTVWAPSNQLCMDPNAEEPVYDGVLIKQMDAFAEANKDKWNIKWEYAAVGEDKLYTEISTDPKAGADVFFYAADQTAIMVEQGIIARLGGSVEKMVKENIDQYVYDTVSVDGKLYGIPFTHNTFIMYYDKSLLSEDDVKTMEGIMAKDLGEGAFNFHYDSGGGWKGGAWYYGAGLQIYGASGTEYDKGCDWNNATGLAVTNYLIDLIGNAQKVAYGEEANVTEKFAEHKLGACFDGSWNYGPYHEALGDDLGVAVLPTFNVGGKDVQLRSFYGAKAIGVNAQATTERGNSAAAIAFAEYLGNTENQVLRYELSAQVPADNTAAAQIKGTNLAVIYSEQVAKYSVVQPSNSNFSNNYWSAAGGLFDGINNGEVTKANAQEKLDQFVEAMKNIK
ncbi:MAG: extracellular solute-binding protein [Agathobacter sp.]|nr:extracellular solute-binding protein [Agathobacter sp.]